MGERKLEEKKNLKVGKKAEKVRQLGARWQIGKSSTVMRRGGEG